jgi:hypothetical protein
VSALKLDATMLACRFLVTAAAAHGAAALVHDQQAV